MYLIIKIILVLAHASQAVQRQTSHFSVKLNENDWFNQLHNPCNYDSIINRTNRGLPVYDNSRSTENVLKISGRENEIRTITGTILARLIRLKNNLVSSN